MLKPMRAATGAGAIEAGRALRQWPGCGSVRGALALPTEPVRAGRASSLSNLDRVLNHPVPFGRNPARCTQNLRFRLPRHGNEHARQRTCLQQAGMIQVSP